MTLQITAGADITQCIEQILQEASSAAFLGVLANVGKFQPSLFSGALAPLLSDPYLIYWDSRRAENVGGNFIAWSWAQAGEVIFELAKNWVLAPHRKRALLDVAVELLKTDDIVAQRLKALIATWKLPDTPKEALEFKLIFAELDRDNYEQTVDEESGTTVVLKLSYPEALLREAQEWQEKSAKPLRYILLPSEIEKLLQQGKPIDDDSASRLFELMQSCKADSEIELHAKLECEVALAAALVVCGDTWLSGSPEAKEITIAVIKDVLLRTGTTYQEIRNERIGSPRNELKFAAHAAAHLWIKHQPKASEWESAVLRVLTSGNYHAAGAIFQIAYANRHLLGSGWARLLQAATMWSGLIMLSVDNDAPESAKQPWDFWLARLRRFSLQRDTPSAGGLKLARIAKGCERIDYAQRLRAYNSGAIRWREKPKRRRGMELDTHFLAVAFGWLTKGDATGSWAGDTRLVNEVWTYEVSRAKARAKKEDREYDLPSNPLGYELLAKLAALSLAAPPGQAHTVWESVLSHGPSAHYAVQQFTRSFFQLAKTHDSDRFEAVWREMIEYGLSANWTKLHGVWFYGVRIICDMLGFGNERVLLALSPGAALRMQDIYERWAIAHLGDDEECVSRFCYFLTSEFAAPLRLDGLRWISQTLKVSGRSDRWYRGRTTDALIELLNVSVSQNAGELASSIDARQALVELTANLADRGLPTALALQERIKLLR